MSPLAQRRLVKGVLWVGLLVVLTYLLSRPVEEYLMARHTGVTISRAVMVREDGSRQPLTLPVQWRSSYRELVTRVFELELTLDKVPVEGVYLYLPFFEPRLRVWVRDTQLYDSRIQGMWSPLDRSTSLVHLPRNVLQQGANTVRLAVETGPAPLGSLSQVVAGSLSELRSVYLLRSFFSHTIKPIIFGMQLFLALAGLLLFALRPKDVVFGWLGLLMATASVPALAAMETGLPRVAAASHSIYLLIPAAGLSLIGFSLSLTGLRASRHVLALTIAIPLALFVLTAVFSLSGPALGFLFSFPFFLGCTTLSIGVLTSVSLREPRLEVILFLFSLVLLAVGTAHDFAIRLGWIADGMFLSVFSRFFSVTAIVIFIVRRLADQADSLDQAAEVLRQKLWEKEAQLATYFQQQKKLDEARVLAEERSRITADLHDGVAGHLTTIVALSDQPEDVSREIKQSARNALIDLRMVIDTMAVREGSLRYYLSLFRNRCLEPLENLGINVIWSMARLPEIANLSQERALNIMRVLQEAVNNALRHGNPDTIVISGMSEGRDQIRLTVTNNRGVPRPATESGGMGLINMRKRARALGGSLDFTLTGAEASLVLIFPVSP
ncbi:sensor histidine kinase [Acidimangrovimonas pyrenivorans]|uniref:ATP-binding protein n=1 Tax=Acidimangrovimonas pyrenivorans TaxID=2030798 RepID=A0ABV7AGK1_9RHOB